MNRSFLLINFLLVSSIGFSQTLFVPNGTVGGSGNGNVGIGQSNPTSRLHVYKPSSLDLNFETDFDNAVRLYLTGANQQWSVRKLNNNDFSIVDDTDGGTMPFRIEPGAGYNAFRIQSDGNIGIGTSDATSKLHVYRSGGLNMNLETSGDNAVRLYFTGSNQQWSLRKFNNNKIGFADDTNGGKIPFSIEPGASSNTIYVNSESKVGIGTTDFTGNHKLRVEGSIGAREIKVEASGWSDFVFYDNYELRTLEEVEEHIVEKGHLPEIPSESEVAENGINLGEMNAKLLQKIEELTLYMIDMNKRVSQLENENQELKSKVSALSGEK